MQAVRGQLRSISILTVVFLSSGGSQPWFQQSSETHEFHVSWWAGSVPCNHGGSGPTSPLPLTAVSLGLIA